VNVIRICSCTWCICWWPSNCFHRGSWQLDWSLTSLRKCYSLHHKLEERYSVSISQRGSRNCIRRPLIFHIKQRRWATRTTLKTGDEIRCCRDVNRCCSSYDTRRGTHGNILTLCKRCTRWNDISCCGVLIFRCCFTCWRRRISERRLVCICVYLELSKPYFIQKFIL
jgi:hypothetical protein